MWVTSAEFGKTSIFLIAALSLTSGLGRAQVAGDCEPSSLNIPEVKYPCVYPDHRALFRVVAPEAQKVSVRLGGSQDFKMARGPDNVWSVSTSPLVPLLHGPYRWGRCG